MPQPGEIKVDNGRLQVFDPGYGPEGQFVHASSELIKQYNLAERFPEVLQDDYAGNFGNVPEGKMRIIDPQTGLAKFVDKPPDPAAAQAVQKTPGVPIC